MVDGIVPICYVNGMEQDQIRSSVEELIAHLRQPAYLYGSRRWGWCTWIKGDIELEVSSSRSQYQEYYLLHPEFLVQRIVQINLMHWSPVYRPPAVDVQFTFEGDVEALEREVIWLRLSA
jgi:hypothetical protein